MSTTKQDLERQVHAVEQVSIEASRIFVDEKSGTTIDRPGLHAALPYAREGDVLVARTSLYRHMPPRPAEPLTADGATHPSADRNQGEGPR